MGRAPITQRTVKKTDRDDFGMDVVTKPFRQMGRDVVVGTRNLVQQGKAAVRNISESASRIKRFVGK